MAEVLAGISSLLGTSGVGSTGIMGVAPAATKIVGQNIPEIQKTPTLLESLTKTNQDFSAYKQANPSEQLKMMQLQQPGQLSSIQQQDLMAILKGLGGY